jgi:hypothetical protein
VVIPHACVTAEWAKIGWRTILDEAKCYVVGAVVTWKLLPVHISRVVAEVAIAIPTV